MVAVQAHNPLHSSSNLFPALCQASQPFLAFVKSAVDRFWRGLLKFVEEQRSFVRGCVEIDSLFGRRWRRAEILREKEIRIGKAEYPPTRFGIRTGFESGIQRRRRRTTFFSEPFDLERFKRNRVWFVARQISFMLITKIIVGRLRWFGCVICIIE